MVLRLVAYCSDLKDISETFLHLRPKPISSKYISHFQENLAEVKFSEMEFLLGGRSARLGGTNAASNLRPYFCYVKTILYVYLQLMLGAYQGDEDVKYVA